MKYARSVAQYWSWLPAFRAVAETEHLPSAAKALCVSASAVSRTIKLLEEELGEPLFDRQQGRLTLNANGEVLLACVRASMRLVHEGTEVMRDSQLHGPFRIAASPGLAADFILPFIGELNREHPALRVSLRSSFGLKAEDALQQGRVDMMLVENVPAGTAVSVRPLIRVHHDVFVPQDAPKMVNLSSYPFVAPDGPDNPDGWPLTRDRVVALRVDSLATAISAATAGVGAVVAPVSLGLRAGLRRLHESDLPQTELSLLCRSPLPQMRAQADQVADFFCERAVERAKQLSGVELLETDSGRLVA